MRVSFFRIPIPKIMGHIYLTSFLLSNNHLITFVGSMDLVRHSWGLVITLIIGIWSVIADLRSVIRDLIFVVSDHDPVISDQNHVITDHKY